MPDDGQVYRIVGTGLLCRALLLKGRPLFSFLLFSGCARVAILPLAGVPARKRLFHDASR
ncbi:hypothetical protein BURKHO8Y_450058 [Burkholderia sp. 8Y]|nr:hypothetical protein BURKHO8Y_450058 [Burkholderia sp. 8Y]